MIALTGHFSENAVLEGIHTSLYLEQQKHVYQMLQPTLKKDGNQWCCIWGELPVDCIVGFGDTPAEAIQEFTKDFYTNRINQPNKQS